MMEKRQRMGNHSSCGFYRSRTHDRGQLVVQCEDCNSKHYSCKWSFLLIFSLIHRSCLHEAVMAIGTGCCVKM